MLKLPSPIVIQKNKLNTASPWLLLLDVTLVNPSNPLDTSEYHLVLNTEDVTYNSQLYTAFPFEIEPTKLTSQNSIPTVTLKISNVTRVVQADLEAYQGAVNSTAKLTVVHAANLAQDFSELEMEFTILDCYTDVNWVVFTLGAPNPLRRKFPLDRYVSTHCQWKFKSCECGYTGETYETCKRSYDDCVLRDRLASFGGFMGLRSGKLRVV